VTTVSPNEIYLNAKPLDLAKFSELRRRALLVVSNAAAPKASPSESMALLAQALTDAPGSAVLAVELAKAAVKAGDERRKNIYIRIAEPLASGQSKLEKTLAALTKHRQKQPKLAAAEPKKTAGAVSKNLTRLSDGVEFEAVCSWLQKAFAEGHPPVDDVAQQSTEGIECQLLNRFALAPEVEAVPVVVAAHGRGNRVYAWVAATFKGALWLSPLVADSLSPEFHPDGNGFSIALQRTAAYGAGLPELSVYLTERRTVIDVALNEQEVLQQNRIAVVTFDIEPPQLSKSIVLHLTKTRSLVDGADTQLPKGYEHSKDLGRPVVQSFQLQWGDNRVKLTPHDQVSAEPIVQVLFGV
jgi:hypothetical protein